MFFADEEKVRIIEDAEYAETVEEIVSKINSDHYVVKVLIDYPPKIILKDTQMERLSPTQ